MRRAGQPEEGGIPRLVRRDDAEGAVGRDREDVTALGPHLIAIAGPSSSGKSTLARALAERLGPEHCVVLCQDEFYRDLNHMPLSERSHANFDVPGAIDSLALIRTVKRLLRNEAAAVPVYDFGSHTRTGEERPVAPRPYVIVEGTLVLHWAAIRRRSLLRVYVDLARDACYQRRLTRDVQERGRTPESVAEQWQRSVWPMHRRYVAPTRRYADLVLDGRNPCAGVQPMLEALRERLGPA